MTPHSNFNRMITNSIVLAVRLSETGEVHGSWPVIADKILCELNGYDDHGDIVDRMQEHLLAVGLDYLTEGSPVVFFKSRNGDLNLVDRSLCDVE